MEIYNETITDLLCDTRKKKPLGIREDVNVSGYYVNVRRHINFICLRGKKALRHLGENLSSSNCNCYIQRQQKGTLCNRTATVKLGLLLLTYLYKC